MKKWRWTVKVWRQDTCTTGDSRFEAGIEREKQTRGSAPDHVGNNTTSTEFAYRPPEKLCSYFSNWNCGSWMSTKQVWTQTGQCGAFVLVPLSVAWLNLKRARCQEGLQPDSLPLVDSDPVATLPSSTSAAVPLAAKREESLERASNPECRHRDHHLQPSCIAAHQNCSEADGLARRSCKETLKAEPKRKQHPTQPVVTRPCTKLPESHR
jgi:hypothetical protein